MWAIVRRGQRALSVTCTRSGRVASTSPPLPYPDVRSVNLHLVSTYRQAHRLHSSEPAVPGTSVVNIQRRTTHRSASNDAHRWASGPRPDAWRIVSHGIEGRSARLRRAV